jgi:hypothetical protein
MGYGNTDITQREKILGAGFGFDLQLSTIVTNSDIGAGSFPSKLDLDNGQIIGAFVDVIIPTITNTFAGGNWILADAGYPVFQVVPNGHGAIDTHSNLTLACSTRVAGTFNYARIYGDTNFSSIFQSTPHYFGHAVTFTAKNIRSEQNNLYLESFIFIFRFYVR